MKNIILCLLLLLYSCFAFAQKLDNNWLLGIRDGATQSAFYGGMTIHFPNDTLKLDTTDRYMAFRATNASISDSLGNLLFASNGVFLMNKLGDTLYNGGDLNPVGETAAYAQSGQGMDIAQANLILPISKTKYYLIHETSTLHPTNGFRYVGQLFYSIIDSNMPFTNGLGGVISKNNILINNMIASGFLTACKHANGKDWWLLVATPQVNEYYRFLVTENGIVSYSHQYFPYTSNWWYDGGQAVFSPDGTMYAQYLYGMGVALLYDFDRCKGELSNQRVLPNIPNLSKTGGIAFSANNKVLYVASDTAIYQYDVTANNIIDTRDTVAVYDGYMSPTMTSFYLMQLAPDGKIYQSSANSTDKLHIIHSPDSLGLACNVEQHGLHLPHINNYSLPNFPHYRLGADTTKPCALSSNQSAMSNKQVLLYPNPVRERLHLESSEVLQKGVFVLFNLAGQEMLRQEFVGTQTEIKVEEMAAGMYFYRIFEGEKEVGYGKVVIVK
ncbi:MAG: T9SS type A sorting domain-containing protein [Bacteroidia bacterium]